VNVRSLLHLGIASPCFNSLHQHNNMEFFVCHADTSKTRVDAWSISSERKARAYTRPVRMNLAYHLGKINDRSLFTRPFLRYRLAKENGYRRLLELSTFSMYLGALDTTWVQMSLSICLHERSGPRPRRKGARKTLLQKRRPHNTFGIVLRSAHPAVWIRCIQMGPARYAVATDICTRIH
jgi:hypothetical protein